MPAQLLFCVTLVGWKWKFQIENDGELLGKLIQFFSFAALPTRLPASSRSHAHDAVSI
jgi:hypothetical protein